jgi:hypothetical protein
VLFRSKPFEEIFTGSNSVRYKHVYYVAKYIPSVYDPNWNENLTTLYDPKNKCQAKEVKDVRWFTDEDAQSKINASNVERKELLKRVHMTLSKHYSTGRL